MDLDVTHPIFHSFFEIKTLDIVPRPTDARRRPIFRALFEDNDPNKRMHDRSPTTRHGHVGVLGVSDTGYRRSTRRNEAYKIGINVHVRDHALSASSLDLRHGSTSKV